jgi:hypothetical protein
LKPQGVSASLRALFFAPPARRQSAFAALAFGFGEHWKERFRHGGPQEKKVTIQAEYAPSSPPARAGQPS